MKIENNYPGPKWRESRVKRGLTGPVIIHVQKCGSCRDREDNNEESQAIGSHHHRQVRALRGSHRLPGLLCNDNSRWLHSPPRLFYSKSHWSNPQLLGPLSNCCFEFFFFFFPLYCETRLSVAADRWNEMIERNFKRE